MRAQERLCLLLQGLEFLFIFDQTNKLTFKWIYKKDDDGERNTACSDVNAHQSKNGGITVVASDLFTSASGRLKIKATLLLNFSDLIVRHCCFVFAWKATVENKGRNQVAKKLIQLFFAVKFLYIEKEGVSVFRQVFLFAKFPT